MLPGTSPLGAHPPLVPACAQSTWHPVPALLVTESDTAVPTPSSCPPRGPGDIRSTVSRCPWRRALICLGVHSLPGDRAPRPPSPVRSHCCLVAAQVEPRNQGKVPGRNDRGRDMGHTWGCHSSETMAKYLDCGVAPLPGILFIRPCSSCTRMFHRSLFPTSAIPTQHTSSGVSYSFGAMRCLPSSDSAT